MLVVASGRWSETVMADVSDQRRRGRRAV